MKKICALFALLIVAVSCSSGTSQPKKQDRRESSPFITGDTFRAHSNHLFDETTNTLDCSKIQEGDVVFVKTDYLDRFFKEYHAQIPAKYVLLTHNSDHPVPGPFASYLNDDKILAWFGQNAEGQTHAKLHPLPIGLENRYNSYGDPRVLEKARNEHLNAPKETLLYMNFSIGTCYDARHKVYSKFEKAPYCKVATRKTYPEYLKDIARTKFVLSPRGNGLDCHRTWEALYMGAIPIVKASAMDAAFEGLPVLIVQDWDEITPEFLEQKYLEMRQKEYPLERLNAGHWWYLIHSITRPAHTVPTKNATLSALTTKTRYQLTSEALDVIIPCIPKDKKTLELCIQGIKQNGKNIRRIIVISSERLTDQAEWFDEKKYPFTKLDIATAIFNDEAEAKAYLQSPNCRIGWIYQQLLKLYSFKTIEGISSNVLSLDADTVFLNPVEFLGPSGEALFNPGTEYNPPYFEHANRLLPGLKKLFPLDSGIAHHMVFQKSVMEDLFHTIETHHQKQTWQAFCACIDREQLAGSCASEYEIYFNFAFAKSDQMKIRTLKCNLSSSSDKFTAFQKKGYHYVSHHAYLRNDK